MDVPVKWTANYVDILATRKQMIYFHRRRFVVIIIQKVEVKFGNQNQAHFIPISLSKKVQILLTNL